MKIETICESKGYDESHQTNIRTGSSNSPVTVYDWSQWGRDHTPEHFKKAQAGWFIKNLTNGFPSIPMYKTLLELEDAGGLFAAPKKSEARRRVIHSFGRQARSVYRTFAQSRAQGVVIDLNKKLPI